MYACVLQIKAVTQIEGQTDKQQLANVPYIHAHAFNQWVKVAVSVAIQKR